MIIRKKEDSKNFTKLTQRGISLIVLIITIIVIIILATAVIVTVSTNNPIDEANTARYESDRDNMQALFTNTVAKVMAKSLGTVNVSAAQLNAVTSGVNSTTGQVSYTVVDAVNSANASGTIIFDKGTNTDIVFYTGKQLPIYKAGETKWYVDSEGTISLEVAGNKYGTGQIMPAGLYDANNVMVASWDELVTTYGLDVTSDYTSSTYKTSENSMYSILTNNEELSTAIKVIIDNEIANIGTSAFRGCSTLTSVTIGDAVTSIGASAFRDCTGLTSVTISDAVISIGNYAFYNCKVLPSMTIPESVITIGNGVFRDCDGLTSVTIPDSVITIGNNAFYSCSKLESAVIGNSVESIGEWTFYGCSSLTSVTIGNSVENIGNRAFMDCSRLTSVTIPDSVTSIGDSAFWECRGLTSLTIGSSLESIGNAAFYYCGALSEIKVDKNNTTYHSRENSNYIIETATNTLIRACNNTIIPDYVTSIGGGAFSSCSGLTTIGSVGSGAALEIPDAVTSIGGYAFNECSGLTSIEIPENITSIGAYFLDDTNEELEVSFSDVFDISLEGISQYAFAGFAPDGKSFQLKKLFSDYGDGNETREYINLGNGVKDYCLVQNLKINEKTRKMVKILYDTLV